MYIGNIKGLHHLVYEIVDNAADEALPDIVREIFVQINEDNSITDIPLCLPRNGIPFLYDYHLLHL